MRRRKQNKKRKESQTEEKPRAKSEVQERKEN
jgi:hypothetical protein